MYTVFVRNWYKRSTTGIVPGPGKKTVLKKNVETEAEARAICQLWNANHKPGKLSRKAEYTSI